MFRGWVEEYHGSIKSADTEEKLDLAFYRPFGFVIAKVACRLKMTPTQLSLLGAATGIAGGRLYYYNDSTPSLVLGTILIVLASVLDSSDGQLARLTGKSSSLGMMIDGTCDGFVFASIYIHACLSTAPGYDWYVIIPIGIAGGLCHFFQSAILDFYNKEYRYFGYGMTTADNWNPGLEEVAQDLRAAKTFRAKFVRIFGFFWIWLQHVSISRRTDQRLQLKALTQGPRADNCQAGYRDHNRTILKFWRLMGPNFHTIMIIVFVFLKRFDLYLFFVDLTSLNLAILVLRHFQRKQDSKLFRWFQSAESGAKP